MLTLQSPVQDRSRLQERSSAAAAQSGTRSLLPLLLLQASAEAASALPWTREKGLGCSPSAWSWLESGEKTGSKGLLAADRSSSGGEDDELGSFCSLLYRWQPVSPQGAQAGGSLVLVHTWQAWHLCSTQAVVWSCRFAGLLIAAMALRWDVGFGHHYLG